MSFDEFRQEIIERVRRSEVNKFVHLYIKAKNWSDILKIFKITEYYEWSFENGIIDFELLYKIPEEIREKEGIYDRKFNLNDHQNLIFLLNHSDLTISQTGDVRCRIVMFGNSKVSAILQNNSMIDLEQYHNSCSQIITHDDSFLHALVAGESISTIQSHGNSTIKLEQNKNSKCSITIYDNSFLNAETLWFSQLNVIYGAKKSLLLSKEKSNIQGLNNHKVLQRERSEITIDSGEQ